MHGLTLIHAKEYWTAPRRLWASVDTGRKPGRLPGGHVGDIADLKKAVMLCPSCVGKFNPKSHGYVTKSNLPFVRGKCDGCKSYMQRGHLFVHHKFAELL